MKKEQEKVQKITSLPGKVTNKNVYLVRVEDTTENRKSPIAFVTNNVDYSSSYVSFIGYKIGNSSIAELKTYEDAIKLANKSESELYSMTYSLQKLISVRNITYKLKA